MHKRAGNSDCGVMDVIMTPLLLLSSVGAVRPYWASSPLPPPSPSCHQHTTTCCSCMHCAPPPSRSTTPQVIQDELGAPWYEIYADLTPEPIAAASLGQVLNHATQYEQHSALTEMGLVAGQGRGGTCRFFRGEMGTRFKVAGGA
jgi:ABC1 atypical kinase-like domain